MRKVSSREMTEWMAFASIEPFGYDADMFGHAQTAAIIANTNRDPKKNPTPYNILDFMPVIDHEDPTEDPDERAKRVGDRLFDDLKSLN